LGNTSSISKERTVFDHSKSLKSGIQTVVPEPKDFTMVLTLEPKLLEAIFLPGTWKGFDTASTYAAWNFLKN
jgi:hypothetical protein